VIFGKRRRAGRSPPTLLRENHYDQKGNICVGGAAAVVLIALSSLSGVWAYAGVYVILAAFPKMK
jgi:hypothetical protein